MPELYLTHPYCFSEVSMFFTTSYLCPCSHPSLFLPPSNFLCPPPYSLSVSHQMSAHQLCSDGWEEQTGWVFMERACTQTAKRACAPTYMQRASRIDLLQQGARTFVPESEDLPVFSHIYSLCMTTSIWNRCPKVTCDCRQTWATVREGQEFCCFSANWISISFLCVWLIGKWLDCRFSPKWGQRGFVARQGWLSQYFFAM